MYEGRRDCWHRLTNEFEELRTGFDQEADTDLDDLFRVITDQTGADRGIGNEWGRYLFGSLQRPTETGNWLGRRLQ